MKKLINCLVIIVLTSLLTATYAQNNTIHIDPSLPNSSQENGSIEHPFNSWWDVKWIPGNTYLQKRGTASVGVYVNIDSSGVNEAGRITIDAYGSGVLPVMDGGNIQWSAFRCFDQAFISIRNFKFTNGTNDCLDLINTSNAVLDNIECYNSTRIAALISGDNITIMNSKFYDNEGAGLLVFDGVNQTVRKCVFFNNTIGGHNTNEDALFIGNGSRNFLVEDCIAYNNPSTHGGSTGFDASGDLNTGYTSGVFRRCISYNNGRRGFASSGSPVDTINFEYCLSYDNYINFLCYEVVNTNITNCTSGSAGLISLQMGETMPKLTIQNCLFTGEAPFTYLLSPNLDSLSSNYNCFDSNYKHTFLFGDTNTDFDGWKKSGYDTVGSFSADPLTTFDFHLLKNSPCLDAGTFIDNIHGVAGAKDLGNNPITGIFPDIGVYNNIPKHEQIITFESLSGATLGDGDFTLSASSNYDLNVLFSSSNISIAQIFGNTVHIDKAGITEITAFQPGNDTIYAAGPIVRSLIVNDTVSTKVFNNSVKETNLLFYPNPAKNYIKVNIDGNAIVEIFTMQGLLLKKKQVSPTENTITVNELISGCYVVKIIGNSKFISDILIVE